MADDDKENRCSQQNNIIKAHGNDDNNETKENSIKSVAIVKHQVVRSPANFARLKCNTDLNIPPSNWLHSSINSYGFQQALSQSTGGFPSFSMASLFPDSIGTGNIDVIAPGDNIKGLLKLPYAPNSTISMMVHRIGNTLLIDDFDVQRFLLQQEENNWHWLRSFICNHILNDPDRNALDTRALNDSTYQRNLLTKFLYHSLSRTDEVQPEAESESNDKLNLDLLPPQIQQPPINGPLLPEPNIEENVPDPKNQHMYHRNIIWTFENIRMLIGSDMPIFGGGKRPCISLRLRNSDEPINVLTGIDYWLDNLMCNVPEVAMCFHQNGFVEKYEVIKTEDLPNMEDSKFSPKVIRNVAQNILSFLKHNATKPGHTYWLFKGKHDDVVKLYDLTSLCTNGEFESAQTTKPTESTSKPQSGTNEKDDKNPFKIPVGMLFYKTAKNMKNNGKIGPRKAGSIKALLENSIELLPRKLYPQIVSSSFYMLSDLHIPIGVDPINPIFEDSFETESVYEDEQSNFDDTESWNADEENVGSQSGDENSIAVVDAAKDASKNKKSNNLIPEPIDLSLDERCTLALCYISNGLNCLQYFTMTEEKLSKEREEIAKQTEKIRIAQEEQNPHMAKPYQAIPMPYESLNVSIKTSPKQDTETKKKHSRKGKKSRKNHANAKATIRTENSLSTKRPEISSWNMHLRLLLLEKTCLIYAILTEQAYLQERYGVALRYIALAMKCHHVVIKYMQTLASLRKNYKTNLLARAGDCFFQLSLKYLTIDRYLAEYSLTPLVDVAILGELRTDLESIENETIIPYPQKNMEHLHLTSIWCYETALDFVEGNVTGNEIIVRIGSVLNELGVKYMHWSQEEWNKNRKIKALMENNTGLGEYIPDQKDKAATEENPLFLTLALKSYNCLKRGIKMFEKIDDNVNLAVVLSNLGRCMRLRAHLITQEDFIFKKEFYKKAFNSYERALDLLVSKKSNPQLWENVSWDLSTGKFVLGKLMLDQFNNSMTAALEQEIIDNLMQALKHCNVDTPGSRQNMYISRAGLIYHYLGNIYCRAYKQTTDENDRRTKKYLQLCRMYFDMGAKNFQSIEAPTEFLAIQVNRLDLQLNLFERYQTYPQKLKALNIGLSLVCASIDHFRKIENLEENNVKNLTTHLRQFETFLQTIFKHLIRITMNKQRDAKIIVTYKRLYGETLQKNDIDRDNYVIFGQHLLKIIENILQSNVIDSFKN